MATCGLNIMHTAEEILVIREQATQAFADSNDSSSGCWGCRWSSGWDGGWGVVGAPLQLQVRGLRRTAILFQMKPS